MNEMKNMKDLAAFEVYCIRKAAWDGELPDYFLFKSVALSLLRCFYHREKP